MAAIGNAVACVVTLALDVTAGILGIQAQAAQNKTKKLTVLFIQCEKLVYKAHHLGIAAAVLLVAAHALAKCLAVFSGIELYKAAINKKLTAIRILVVLAALILLSWIALIVGFSLLLAGAMSNSKSKTSCGFVHGHNLALGGIMCFVHAGITVAYYVTATAAAQH